MKKKNLTLLASILVLLTNNLAGQTSTPASNFTYPQGVYNGEEVEHTQYPNRATGQSYLQCCQGSTRARL